MTIRHATRLLWSALLAAVALAAASSAQALPLYARQTGQNCVACHVSFPELTPYGRYFKLMGYTLGQRQLIPLAMMAQVEYTKIKNNAVDDGTGTGTTTNLIEKDGQVAFTGFSAFYGGKVTDWFGAFGQWTCGYIDHPHHCSTDNTDFRLVGHYDAPGSEQPDLIYGATLHNNPTVQDVWNSTPAFGFPFTTSPVGNTPAVGTLIDGGLAQQATGLGGYLFWKKSLYGELTFYRASTGSFGWLRAGPLDQATRVKGYNPYWRFAWNREWDSHSLEVGTFGLHARQYLDPTDTNSATDSFTDVGLDAQYQYITDPHTATAQLTYIHEHQSRDGSFAAGATANPTDTLKTFRAKGTYYFDRKYGATVQYATTTGSADAGLYPTGAGNGFAASNLPDSTSWTLELNYVPIQNVRLMLQYTAYTKFQGASSNYDGFGRNASDNNLLFFNVWVAY